MLEQMKARLAVLRESLFDCSDADERRAVIHDIEILAAIVAAEEK